MQKFNERANAIQLKIKIKSASSPSIFAKCRLICTGIGSSASNPASPDISTLFGILILMKLIHIMGWR